MLGVPMNLIIVEVVSLWATPNHHTNHKKSLYAKRILEESNT